MLQEYYTFSWYVEILCIENITFIKIVLFELEVELVMGLFCSLVCSNQIKHNFSLKTLCLKCSFRFCAMFSDGLKLHRVY